MWKEDQTAQVDNLWLTNAQGGYLLQLTRTDTCENQNPGFSPDGQQIAFFRTYYPDQIGESGVWTISTDGAWERLVADIPELVTGTRKELAWSPDGSWLAYLLGSEQVRQRFTWWRHKAAFRSFWTRYLEQLKD